VPSGGCIRVARINQLYQGIADRHARLQHSTIPGSSPGCALAELPRKCVRLCDSQKFTTLNFHDTECDVRCHFAAAGGQEHFGIMKIVGFNTDEGPRLGVVEGDVVIDLQAVDKNVPSDLGEWLRRDNGDLSAMKALAGRAPPDARRPLNGLEHALPVARPGKIICLGVNYLEHVKEAFQRDDIARYPTIFMRCQSSLLPHGHPIVVPRVSKTLDYEGEMVVIIGKRAKHLDVSDATSCIAGYSCCNDGSVREFQGKTTQWDMAKNFDGTGAFGPWMVTADELPPGGQGLNIQVRLNGQVMQSDNTGNMIFSVAEIIAYITQGMTLEPGDIIFTGTPSGVGFARKPPVWMKDGDLCEIDIEGVGVLSNSIADENG
jgi:acylpyruvate hydrolase